MSCKSKIARFHLGSDVGTILKHHCEPMLTNVAVFIS